MKKAFAYSGISALVVLAVAMLMPTRAAAQDPVLTPVIVSEAAPIVVQAITPKPKPGVQKFQGLVVNANSAQVTLRQRGNETTIQTFALSQEASAKMLKIIDKGGYQYGDKVTVYYNSTTHQALKVKGKPSRPL
jgi:maltoporin